MAKSKTILLSAEYSKMGTGYGNITRELAMAFLKAGHKVIEYAAYCFADDMSRLSADWQIIPAGPHRGDAKAMEAYNKQGNSQFGGMYFDQVCAQVQPDVVCTPAGELVLTKHGYKPIETIKVGEEVKTHKGRWRKVTKLYERHHEGDLYYIYSNGCSEPVKLTAEHPVLIYRHRKHTSKIHKAVDLYNEVEPEWIAAKDVKVGDKTVFVPSEFSEKDVTLDLMDYVGEVEENEDGLLVSTRSKAHNANKIPRYITLDEDFGTFLGYMMADGWLGEKCVEITFGEPKYRWFAGIQKTIKDKIGLTIVPHPYKERNAERISVSSRIFAEFLRAFLSEKTSINSFDLWSRSALKGFVTGAIRGDGCYRKNGICFSNGKPKLAKLVRLLLFNFDIPTVISHWFQESGYALNGGTNYEVSAYGSSGYKTHNLINGQDDNPYVSKKSSRSTVVQLKNRNFISSVKEITVNSYNGLVYNLGIEEDNSYTIGCTEVHNCDQRDFWYISHINNSPARRFFNFIYTPTIDSSPAKDEWMWQCADADIVNSYSYFGKNVLQVEGGLKHGRVTPGGVDDSFFEMYEKFKGQNKETFRKKFGFPKNAIICNFTSRNQRRKLFPDIIYCMDRILEHKDCKNFYFHFHTSYPDNPHGSWEFPSFLARIKNAHRILFTYHCAKCKNVLVKAFSDAIMDCPRCHGPMMLPSPQTGHIDRETLSELMYAADFGTNPAIGGGQELSLSEHKALGNPVVSIEWAGMHEQGYNSDGSIPDYDYEEGETPYLGGICVKKSCLWIEPESNQFRAYMDRDDFIEKIQNWVSLRVRDKEGWAALQREAVQGANSTYRWGHITQKYLEQIDGLDSTKSRWKFLPPVGFDPRQMIDEIRKHPIEHQVDAYRSFVSPYMNLDPMLFQKIHADLISFHTFGLIAPSKHPLFSDIGQIYGYMASLVDNLNKFEQIRQKVNHDSKTQ